MKGQLYRIELHCTAYAWSADGTPPPQDTANRWALDEVGNGFNEVAIEAVSVGECEWGDECLVYTLSGDEVSVLDLRLNARRAD